MKYFIIIVIVVISNTFLGVAKPMKNQAEIYFAGGCFWGTEHFLKQIRGVESTQVGYANSNVANPSYEQVCSGKTNAAETVKVVYDPKTVDLNLLLDLYFKTIDPTSLNRQGNDRGTQYRTGIYYINKDCLMRHHRMSFRPTLFFRELSLSKSWFSYMAPTLYKRFGRECSRIRSDGRNFSTAQIERCFYIFSMNNI